MNYDIGFEPNLQPPDGPDVELILERVNIDMEPMIHDIIEQLRTCQNEYRLMQEDKMEPEDCPMIASAIQTLIDGYGDAKK